MLPRTKPAKNLIYLDHAATTYLDPRVEKAMQPFWQKRYGNPSSLYKQGKEARTAMDQSRESIAKILNCRSKEIIFTAGGTESVNLAILGTTRAYELRNNKKGHLITSTIEHHSVLHSVEALKQEGWQISRLKVDHQGFVQLKDLKTSIRKDTVLISVMYANNEIGTIEPIAEIGKWLRGLNSERIKKNLPRIYFHTDACQGAGALDLDVSRLGVDLMSINGSKIYGPKQVGLLYVKTGTPLRPLIFGGGQEKDLRSGTENVPGIVGLAEALKIAEARRVRENKRLRNLRDYFIAQLLHRVPRTTLNGPDERLSNKKKPYDQMKPLQRLPNNINVTIEGVEGETLLLYLDSYNVAVSTGSACTTTSTDPSHVIMALGQSASQAHSAMRFTLGRQTTKKDLDYVLAIIPGIVKQLREISSSVKPKT